MEKLEKVKEQMLLFIKECNSKEVIDLFSTLANGKMLRSKLILKIAGFTKDSINLCAIVELIHLASLLHDDVIDDAQIRRAKPSINNLFGNKTAIMLGDILYSKAFSKLTDFNKNIAYTISSAVTKLSIGEIQDVRLTDTFNSSYDNYMEMIYNKTASLIEASSKCAALLLNKDAKKYALYGKNLGLAFQMIDDILDITQDSKTLGKPALLDFMEGKVTIPYLLLFQRIKDKKKLKSLYKKTLNEEESFWIQKQMENTKALEDAITLAKNLGNEAIKIVRGEKNEDELIFIMKAICEREF